MTIRKKVRLFRIFLWFEMSLTNFVMLSSVMSLLIMSPQSAFAYHGREVLLILGSSYFLPLPSGQGNQVKVFVNYTILEPSVTNQTIKAVMKIYSSNGTLIKRTSTTNGFIAQSSAIAQLATTITDNTLRNITAVVTFNSPTGPAPISNSLPVKLNLGQKIKG